MHNWTKRLDAVTLQVQHHLGTLDKDELNWKPALEVWSIAQNLDHLMIANQSYMGQLDALMTERYTPPFIARIGFVVRMFGKMVLGAVEPTRKKKVKTFAIWEPVQSDFSADLVDRFVQHQVELKQVIAAVQPWVDRDAVISSPASHNVVFKLETAIEILVTHEERHLAQAKEVLDQLAMDASRVPQ